MRKHLYFVLKSEFRSELLKTRTLLGLTQEKMAALLYMSPRAYSALESGKFCCSVLTFLFFLIHCPYREEFLNNLISLLSQAGEEIA